MPTKQEKASTFPTPQTHLTVVLKEFPPDKLPAFMDDVMKQGAGDDDDDGDDEDAGGGDDD